MIWLSGVRRAGKTYLSRSVPGIRYYDCELPEIRSRLEDPTRFLAGIGRARIVLDEIQKLANPSQLLKIAADHYPAIKILATGSSTLGASRKFRDTLTGRKISIRLTPITLRDMRDFGHRTLSHRLIFGGLPPLFLQTRLREDFFREWMDDYWARDVEELFRIQQKSPFAKFVELLMHQSGSIFEATTFSRPCEVNRMTITNYLAILEGMHVAHVLRPFNSRRAIEIVAAPRVYSFDTGFVSYFNGWSHVTPANRGILWEHMVLNEIHAVIQSRQVSYWRDKHGNEVDFVVPRHGRPPIAIECKWSAHEFNPGGMLSFARAYPGSVLAVVAQDVRRPTKVRFGTNTIAVLPASAVPSLMG
ncbi:MAG: ATP-binding protein [Candidatus Coatesbacteria bacterium]